MARKEYFENREFEGNRPITDIVRDLADGSQQLIRQEIQLARVEIRTAVTQGKRGAILLGASTIPGWLSAISLTFGIIFAMALILPLWAAALIVGAAQLILALTLALIGRNRLKEVSLKPSHTIESLKEDREWIRHRLT